MTWSTVWVLLGALALTTGCAATPLVTVKPEAERFEDRPCVVTIDSDKLERYALLNHLAIFTGNVIARQNNAVQYADRIEVYLNEKGNRIVRMVSTGNLRIITLDCRTATARQAEYKDLEQRLVLSGDARVWGEDDVTRGERIVIHLSPDRPRKTPFPCPGTAR